MALAAADTPSQPPLAGNTTVSGVVVKGTRAEVETSIDRKSYSVANDLAAQTGSVADVLRNIPSVQVDAQGNPSLQGEGNVTILLDGRPSAQFREQSLGQALQAMPADRIDSIEVMTNPSAEFQAAGTGGIINLVTKKAKGAGWTGSARIGAETHDRASTTVNLGYNSDKLNATGDVMYKHAPQSAFDALDLSQIDPATGLAINSRDLSREHWTYDHWGAHAAADYDLDSRTRVSGSAGYYTSRYRTLYVDQFVQDNASGDPTSALDRTGRERYFHNGGDASLTWRRTSGEGHDLTFSADFSETELRDNRTDLLAPTLPLGQAASSQQVIWTDQAKRARFTTDYDRPIFGGELKLGYGFEYAPNRIDQAAGSGGPRGPMSLDPARHDVFLDRETDNEAYISYDHRLGKVTLLAGLRGENAHFDLDQQTQGVQASHNYARLYPNLHLAYDLGGGRQLTASYSERTNRPNDRQLDPFVISGTPLYFTSGNPNLRPEDQSVYELSYEERKGDRAATVKLFYRDRRDPFNQVYSILPNGAYLEEVVNAGHVQAAGAEWAVSDKLTPKISYNLSLDGYRYQLSAPNLGFLQARSTVTGFGHGGLTWRITPKDFLQFDLVATSKHLNPQGYSEPTYSGSIGYRYIINNDISWMLAVKDPFRTLRYSSVENINGVERRGVTVDSNRSVSLTLVWNFAGKPKDQGFDFGSGDSRP